MKGNLPAVIVSVICAAAAVVFAVLTVINLKPESESAAKPAESNYELSAEVQTDALGASLAPIVSNAMKSAKYPDGILESMKAAYAVNKKTVGRLRIPGSELDTVIVQGSDNSRYLKYNFYENLTYETSSTNYGNIFLDYRCSNTADLSKNMVFHGHTTGKSDGIPKQAFRSLYDFRNADYYKKHPLIKYSTLYGEHTYKICAVFYSTTSEKVDNGYFFNYIYPDMSDSNMTGYIEQVKQRMLYETGVSLEPTDKIITLSTCIYDYGKSVDTRLVVVGRLLHDGESEEIDTSLVKANPDYRRPQIWYNAHGKTNPYKNSPKWQPSPD